MDRKQLFVGPLSRLQTEDGLVRIADLPDAEVFEQEVPALSLRLTDGSTLTVGASTSVVTTNGPSAPTAAIDAPLRLSTDGPAGPQTRDPAEAIVLGGLCGRGYVGPERRAGDTVRPAGSTNRVWELRARSVSGRDAIEAALAELHAPYRVIPYGADWIVQGESDDFLTRWSGAATAQRIPDWMFASASESAASFVKGLWAVAGDWRHAIGSEPSHGVFHIGADMAGDLQVLLRTWGIVVSTALEGAMTTDATSAALLERLLGVGVSPLRPQMQAEGHGHLAITGIGQLHERQLAVLQPMSGSVLVDGIALT